MAFRLRGLDGDAKAPLPASTPAVLKRVRREMSFMSFLAFAAADTVAWRQPAWIVAPRAECHPARQELSPERSNVAGGGHPPGYFHTPPIFQYSSSGPCRPPGLSLIHISEPTRLGMI